MSSAFPARVPDQSHAASIDVEKLLEKPIATTLVSSYLLHLTAMDGGNAKGL